MSWGHTHDKELQAPTVTYLNMECVQHASFTISKKHKRLLRLFIDKLLRKAKNTIYETAFMSPCLEIFRNIALLNYKMSHLG